MGGMALGSVAVAPVADETMANSVACPAGPCNAYYKAALCGKLLTAKLQYILYSMTMALQKAWPWTPGTASAL